MPKRSGRLAAAVYRYRTEHNTPIRQALSIGLGLYIGASPFMGLHLILALGLGWLFRLNRFKVYLAANISNPLFAPVLYGLELQIGTWLRSGQFLSAARLHEVRLQGLAIDLLVGSVVVGLALATFGTLVTYRGSRDRPEEAALVEAAAERYLPVSITAWEFARAKLRTDPVYLQVLKDGRLPSCGTLLDLGCGSGLMLSLIASAADQWRQNRWPPSWPPPPTELRLHGLETRPRVVRRARQALGSVAIIDQRDLSESALPPCDAVLIFDVLHLLSRDVQDRLLADVAGRLQRDGVLIVREANADAGWKFHMVRFGNRFNSFWQGRFGRKYCFDSATGWRDRLTALGFDVESVTHHDTGIFGNVMLQARLGTARERA